VVTYPHLVVPFVKTGEQMLDTRAGLIPESSGDVATTAVPARPSNEAAPAASQLSYTLDPDDAITAVTGDWDRFALDNGGDESLSTKVIGRRLDHFISGDVTLMFVRTLLMSARTLKRTVQRPYRCDSPQLKRFMEMTIVPRGNGVLEVCHRQVRSEPYRYSLPVTAAMPGAGSNFVKRCSLCQRIRVGQMWSEVDDAVLEGRLQPGAAAKLVVVYGVCPDCMSRRGVKP
jgi:hypothetical protein